MKKMSASVGFIINFTASRSSAEGKLKSFVPKLPRKEKNTKYYFYLSSCKFLVSAGRLYSGSVETFKDLQKIADLTKIVICFFCSTQTRKD